jgi:hypothetical protein
MGINHVTIRLYLVYRMYSKKRQEAVKGRAWGGPILVLNQDDRGTVSSFGSPADSVDNHVPLVKRRSFL